MLKLTIVFFLLATFTFACSVYYQPNGRHRGGVIIKAPEDPEIRPMPQEKLPAKY